MASILPDSDTKPANGSASLTELPTNFHDNSDTASSISTTSFPAHTLSRRYGQDGSLVNSRSSISDLSDATPTGDGSDHDPIFEFEEALLSGRRRHHRRSHTTTQQLGILLRDAEGLERALVEHSKAYRYRRQLGCLSVDNENQCATCKLLSSEITKFRFENKHIELKFCRMFYGGRLLWTILTLCIAAFLFAIYLGIAILNLLSPDWSRSDDLEYVASNFPYRVPRIGFVVHFAMRVVEFILAVAVSLIGIPLLIVLMKVNRWNDLDWKRGSDELVFQGKLDPKNGGIEDGVEEVNEWIWKIPWIAEGIISAFTIPVICLVSIQGAIIKGYAGTMLIVASVNLLGQTRADPWVVIRFVCLVSFHCLGWLIAFAVETEFNEMGSWVSWQELVYALVVVPICFIATANVASQSERVLRDLFVAECRICAVNSIVELERKRQYQFVANIFPKALMRQVVELGRFSRFDSQRVVLVNDIQGFTAYCAALSDSVGVVFRFLNRIYSGFDSIVEKNHFEKVKTIGDSHLSFCLNDTLSVVDCARFGLLAAEEMILLFDEVVRERKTRHRAKRLDLSLHLRTGVAIGAVAVFVLGGVNHTFDIAGPAVSEAKLLEQTCPVGSIHMSRNVSEFFDAKSEFSESHFSDGGVVLPVLAAPDDARLSLRWNTPQVSVRADGEFEWNRELTLKQSSCSFLDCLALPETKNFRDFFRFSLTVNTNLSLSFLLTSSALIITSSLGFFLLLPISVSRGIVFIGISAAVFGALVVGCCGSKSPVVSFITQSWTIVLAVALLSYVICEEMFGDGLEPIVQVLPSVAKILLLTAWFISYMVVVLVAPGVPFCFKVPFVVPGIVCAIWVVVFVSSRIVIAVNAGSSAVCVAIAIYVYHRGILRAYHLARAAEARLVHLSVDVERNDKLLRSVFPPVVLDRILNVDFKIGVCEFVDSAAAVYCILSLDHGLDTVESGELEIPRLIALMDAVFSQFDRDMLDGDCLKVKSVGGRYLCVSGLSDLAHEAAKKALAVSFGMKEICQDVNLGDDSFELSAAIGIDLGSISAGVCGTRKVLFDVFGDVINVSCRLAEHCLMGSILCSSASRDVVVREVEVLGTESLGLVFDQFDVELKGKGLYRSWFLTRT